MTTELQVKPLEFTHGHDIASVNLDVLIARLNAINKDNVQVNGIAIDRRKLLAVLKLQRQTGAEPVTLTYGRVSWQERVKNTHTTDYTNHEVTDEPCVQVTVDRAVMRFYNRPKSNRYSVEPAIAVLDLAAQPASPQLEGTPLESDDLRVALQFVRHAAATEESRPTLCCVLFDCTECGIRLVAADGFRLSTADVAAPGIPVQQLLIEAKHTANLIKFLKANTTGRGRGKQWLPVYMSADKYAVTFASEKGAYKLDRPQNTYQYPHYEQLVPAGGSPVTFTASAMLEAVNSVAMVARDGSSIIRLQFTPGKVTVSAASAEVGGASAEFEADVQQDGRIAANQKYLVDVLRQCGDATVTMRVTDPSSPMVFDIPGGRQETVMPMFVQWSTEQPEADQPAPEPEPAADIEPIPIPADDPDAEPDDRTVADIVHYLGHQHTVTSSYTDGGADYYDLECAEECYGWGGYHTRVPADMVK